MFYGSIGLCKYLHKITLKNFCLFLAVLGLHCCLGFSLVVLSRGFPLVMVQRRRLTAVGLLLWDTGSGMHGFP